MIFEALSNACNSHTYLSISLKVIVEYIHTNGQITSVERVRSVPSLWTKLTALGHACVEIAQREQNALEFVFSRAHLKSVLMNEKE